MPFSCSCKMFERVNKKLLPVKAHYFFFLAAMGPILPFLPVIGKQLGVSEIVFGGVSAILPLLFIIVKPLFGFLIDSFHEQRKLIFISLLSLTTLTYGMMALIPDTHKGDKITALFNSTRYCSHEISSEASDNCTLATGVYNATCDEGAENCLVSDGGGNFYTGISFWAYIVLMSIGTIGYSVSNSVSDAICFDVLGDGGQKKYGHQRVWGTIGFGLAALLGGCSIDYISGKSHIKDYTPAYLLTIILMIIDIACCYRLTLPPFPRTESIIRSIRLLVKQPAVSTFLVYATLVGICDAAMIYYLLWYLEDLAKVTNQMENIKLLEGLTVAAETLFGEVVFFPISGKIISKVGYGNCLTMCFALYSLRLGLVSWLPSPWWVLPIEMVLQGPTYALCYATIVGYASEITPPGTSGTMQGLVAGMDDGIGYSLGSILGGVLYRAYGGKWMFLIFSMIAAAASISHCIIYLLFFKNYTVKSNDTSGYEPTNVIQELHRIDSAE